MRKSLKMAVAVGVLATPAMAANMENPLYLPGAGQLYSKTMLGLMHKHTDDTLSQIQSGGAQQHEFPILRVSEELGYGITDRLMILGQVGYTYNPDIERQGLHLGRLGVNYRIFDGMVTSPFVWDVYADAHLGGISKMTGEYTAKGFKYDNYSTGQYGVWVGTKVGQTWGAFTGALYAEAAYYFASDNTEVDIALPTPLGAVKGTAVADMADFQDWNIGIKTSYDINPDWTLGLGFAWKHHGAHEIESAEIEISEMPAGLPPAQVAAMADGFKNRNLEDAFEEFPITLSIARAFSETTQVALYGEYTIDHGDAGSQNTTDIKWEVGARLNLQF